MKNVLTGLVSNIIGRSANNELPTARDEKEELALNIQKAHDEWIAAKAYFESVTDPNLIDYAVLAVDAAEKKYAYLMNKAREFGLKGELNYEKQEVPLQFEKREIF